MKLLLFTVVMTDTCNKYNYCLSVVKSNPQLTVNISNVNYGDEIIANVSLITGNIKLNGTVVLNIKR